MMESFWRQVIPLLWEPSSNWVTPIYPAKVKKCEVFLTNHVKLTAKLWFLRIRYTFRLIRSRTKKQKPCKIKVHQIWLLKLIFHLFSQFFSLIFLSIFFRYNNNIIIMYNIIIISCIFSSFIFIINFHLDYLLEFTSSSSLSTSFSFYFVYFCRKVHWEIYNNYNNNVFSHREFDLKRNIFTFSSRLITIFLNV